MRTSLAQLRKWRARKSRDHKLNDIHRINVASFRFEIKKGGLVGNL